MLQNKQAQKTQHEIEDMIKPDIDVEKNHALNKGFNKLAK